MRAIVVSGGVLAIAAIFGLGVVVGRFVLNRDNPGASAPTNAVMGPIVADGAMGDPYVVSGTDPSLNAPPPTIAAPLPPSTQPNVAVVAPSTSVTASIESDASIAASTITAGCDVRVTRDAPVRSWNQKDRITAMAVGPTCGAAVVSVLLETKDGAALYSLQAPARDFGIAPNSNAEDVRVRLSQLLPTDAVRAAAYPAWPADAPAPTRNEFTRDAYEAVRASNNPVTCLKLPTGTQRCVAADPGSGQIKVFSRG